jgi:hypothetical protein
MTNDVFFFVDVKSNSILTFSHAVPFCFVFSYFDFANNKFLTLLRIFIDYCFYFGQ